MFWVFENLVAEYFLLHLKDKNGRGFRFLLERKLGSPNFYLIAKWRKV